MGIKGNLSQINAIPFQAPPLAPVPPGYSPKTQAVGVGCVAVDQRRPCKVQGRGFARRAYAPI
jgi:hypothetical protein